jgi:uncharacterized protein YcbK (DUF882 family)
MTPNFADAELACKCGCGMLPDQDFMDKVEQLRTTLGFPLPVTSAARCPAHNAAVSATGRAGPHTTGRAIDIGVRGDRAVALIKAALNLGFTGIGIAQKGNSRFIHLDDLQEGRPTIWSY